MNRAAFFTAVRPMFGGKLSQPQIDGMQAILDAADAAGMADPHHVANVLAQVRRETGGYMSPIKETVMPSHQDKNPDDATVIARLDKAFAAGKLKWVKTPYWREGAFGRGPIQITHWRNYERIGKAISVDLRANPELALDPPIGAKIAVVGMRDGLFTGMKLADYKFPAALDASPQANPRRIVNGVDGSDREVTASHRGFVAALVAGGWDVSHGPGVPAAVAVSVVTGTRPAPVPDLARKASARPAAYVAVVVAAGVVWQWGADALAWLQSFF